MPAVAGGAADPGEPGADGARPHAPRCLPPRPGAQATRPRVRLHVARLQVRLPSVRPSVCVSIVSGGSSPLTSVSLSATRDAVLQVSLPVCRHVVAAVCHQERRPTGKSVRPAVLMSVSLCVTRNAVLQGLCRELLCRPHAIQTRLFLVPSLAAADDGDGSTLHFGLLLATLVPPALRPGPDGGQTDGRPATPGDDADWTLQVDASPWLLWSLLTLSHRQLGQCPADVSTRKTNIFE